MVMYFGRIGSLSLKGTKDKAGPTATVGCPFADPSLAVNLVAASKSGCPFHSHKISKHEPMTKAPEVYLRNGTTFIGTSGSAEVLRNIGGGDKIREGCTRFYARAFEDFTLAPFMTVEDDGAEQHGKRLADWIMEKIGGEGTPWTDSGRYGMRQETHWKAWNSKTRDPSVRGDNFKLDDCVVWMRIHFWAMREVGLDKFPACFTWYKGFIGHFIRVYERKAPAYTESAAEWSLDSLNLDAYIQDGYKMKDVIGMV